MSYKIGMNAEQFIKYLKGLIKGVSNKIYLIVDNLRVHHCKILKIGFLNPEN